MRRISIWITIFVSVAVLGFACWLNTSGLSAKPGGENGQQPGQVTSTITPSPDAEKSGGTNDQTGKPGENK